MIARGLTALGLKIGGRMLLRTVVVFDVAFIPLAIDVVLVLASLIVGCGVFVVMLLNVLLIRHLIILELVLLQNLLVMKWLVRFAFYVARLCLLLF